MSRLNQYHSAEIQYGDVEMKCSSRPALVHKHLFVTVDGEPYSVYSFVCLDFSVFKVQPLLYACSRFPLKLITSEIRS